MLGGHGWLRCFSSTYSEAFEDEDDDDATAFDDEDDGDANSSSADEMSTWYSYPLSFLTKRGNSFGYESSHS